MKFNTRLLLLLFINGLLSIEIRTDSIKSIKDFYRTLRSTRLFSNNKYGTLKTLKSIALDARDNYQLSWLNAIQTKDVELTKELAAYCAAKSTQETINLRTKDEILRDMINNLQLYDDDFPENVQNNQAGLETLDTYRSYIALKKDKLSSEIIKRKTGNPAVVFTPYSKRYLPSQDFLEEIEWHKKQTQLVEKKY